MNDVWMMFNCCLNDVELIFEPWLDDLFFFIFDGSWSCCRFCVVYIMSEWCLNDVWVISEWCLDVVSMMSEPCLDDVWIMFAHCLYDFSSILILLSFLCCLNLWQMLGVRIWILFIMQFAVIDFCCFSGHTRNLCIQSYFFESYPFFWYRLSLPAQSYVKNYNYSTLGHHWFAFGHGGLSPFVVYRPLRTAFVTDWLWHHIYCLIHHCVLFGSSWW